MNRSLTLTLTLVTLLAALPASAKPCETESEATKIGSLYLVRGEADDVWLYQESNGRGGLQRADGVKNDTCHGIIQPDTRIF